MIKKKVNAHFKTCIRLLIQEWEIDRELNHGKFMMKKCNLGSLKSLARVSLVKNSINQDIRLSYLRLEVNVNA